MICKLSIIIYSKIWWTSRNWYHICWKV